MNLEKYNVVVESIELNYDKPFYPKGIIKFKVTHGSNKGKTLVFSQNLVDADKVSGRLTAFGLYKFNDLLISLDTTCDVKFVDFVQYERLLSKIANDVKDNSYYINYSDALNILKVYYN